LATSSLRDRLAWIQSVNAHALREYHREGLTLHLTYELEARDAVHELVRGERACCRFLRFELREEPDAIRVTIVAPAESREAAALLFAHFVAAGERAMDDAQDAAAKA
jgi:hypothetical protein